MKNRTTLQSPACCGESGTGIDADPHSTCTLTRVDSTYEFSFPSLSDRVKVIELEEGSKINALKRSYESRLNLPQEVKRETKQRKGRKK